MISIQAQCIDINVENLTIALEIIISSLDSNNKTYHGGCQHGSPGLH